MSAQDLTTKLGAFPGRNVYMPPGVSSVLSIISETLPKPHALLPVREAAEGALSLGHRASHVLPTLLLESIFPEAGWPGSPSP